MKPTSDVDVQSRVTPASQYVIVANNHPKDLFLSPFMIWILLPRFCESRSKLWFGATA